MKNTTTYRMNMAVPKMNFWDQHNLTVEEACAYFRIGEHTMRRLIEANPNAGFTLRIGTRVLIKKHVMAAFLDRCTDI